MNRYMAGGVGGNSVRDNALISARSTFHGAPRPESVFQDIQGETAARTLNFLDHSRVQILPGYRG